MKKKHTGRRVERTRGEAGKILKHILADEFLLAAATRDYCGNITGSGFNGLRQLFGEQWQQVEGWLKQVAGRLYVAGTMARNALKHLARMARITAPAGAGLAIRTMIAELHALHAGLARRLRSDVAVCSGRLRDSRTADFLGELQHFHDQTAGLLASLLQDPPKAVD
jgi:starvation-inducible DNA-binding protein